MDPAVPDLTPAIQTLRDLNRRLTVEGEPVREAVDQMDRDAQQRSPGGRLAGAELPFPFFFLRRVYGAVRKDRIRSADIFRRMYHGILVARQRRRREREKRERRQRRLRYGK